MVADRPPRKNRSESELDGSGEGAAKKRSEVS